MSPRSRAVTLESLVAVGRRVQAVSEGQADAWAGARHFGHAVLPCALGGAAGNEEVASTQHERGRRAALLRTQEEPARLSEGDEGNGRLLDLLGDAVSVPSHAVASIAVQVESDGVELHLVSRRERSAHFLEDGRLQWIA